MERIRKATRDELVVVIAGQFARANRLERGRILDEFVAVTGLRRKHARPRLPPASAAPRQTVAFPDDFNAAMTDAARDLLDLVNAALFGSQRALCLPLGLSM